MNQETIQAIKDSIEHWEINVLKPSKSGKQFKKTLTGGLDDGKWIDETIVKSCDRFFPLCEWHNNNYIYSARELVTIHHCTGCPLHDSGNGCDSYSENPYRKFEQNPCIETAQAMIDTLKSLLPEGE